MTEAIDQLVGQYESRQLTRRKLVQSLAALAAGSRTMSAAQPSPFRGVSLNHASLAVSDVPRAQTFYQELLGIREVSRQANGVNLGLGSSFLGLYQIEPPGHTHHCCIGVDNFDLDRAAETLRRNGLEPSFNRGVEVYFRDPDNTLVQLSANDYRG